jgi:hypothetical protein
MTLRRLRQRLLNADRRLCEDLYARLAALWSASLGPEEEVLLERLFGKLVEREAAKGTPLEAVLARLPDDMVRELRRHLHNLHGAEASVSEPRRAEIRSGSM